MAKPLRTAGKAGPTVAAKPDFADRARTWLPHIAAFLCLAMLAIATVALFDVNAEPKSPASGHVTSVAAQGFAGLRRLLEAQGGVVKLNRFEDGSQDVDRGDLEIITLDDDGGVFSGDYDRGSGKASDSASAQAASQASGDASASDSASSASSEAVVKNQRYVRRMMSGVPGEDGYAIPDTKRIDHVLHHPLGRAVLVVAPKWTVAAATGPGARWGEGADVMPADDVGNVLAVLAPVTWKPVDAAPAPKAQAKTQAQDDSGSGDDEDAPTAVLDRVPYVVTRAKGTGDAVVSPSGNGRLAPGLHTGAIDRLQSVTGPNLVPVLTGPNGAVLLSRVIVTGNRPQTATPVYLLSDPDLLDNQVLSDPARTATALKLVKALTPASPNGASRTPTYVFNLTFNAMGFDHDLLHALSRPPYIGVPIALLVAALGLMWAAFARFGPPALEEMRPALGRGVRILADNAARLMAVTLKEAKLGPAYAQLMRDQVLRIRGYRQIDARESADDLADRISQIYKATDRYSELRDKAARVVTVHQLIDIALRLHAWKNEIGQTESHVANR